MSSRSPFKKLREYKFSYAKLVRDKIPAMIQGDGGKVRLKILTAAAYIKELKRKLLEEVRELSAVKSKSDLLKELADVQEVIDHLLTAHNWSKTDLRRQQLSKRAKVGAFKNKLYIDYIQAGPNFDNYWLKYHLRDRQKFPRL